ncbi:MAG: amidohydrolase [Planctomycetes bacterium]|nr:amidohydrolase [Planctomycetota bacterium]
MSGALQVDNARVWTGNPDRPRASSITIVGARIVALDADPPPGAEVIDARGRPVIPGLIDAHLHLLLGGRSMDRLDLSGVTSRNQFERAVAQRHRSLPPERWLVARGWSQENWPDRALPDASWLAGAGERPVVCYRMDEHAAVVNDAVLARVECPAVDPAGGRIERDPETGAPTGLFLESAAWQLINPLVPDPPLDERRALLLAAQAHAHRLGLTAVGTMEYARDVADVFLPQRERLTLRCRVTLLDRGWPMDLDAFAHLPREDPVAVIGCKAFLDGTLGSRTARMLADYADDPGNRGMLVEIAADGNLHPWARAVAVAGLSPSMHAIGDGAVRLALDVVAGLDPAAHARIEHAQQIDPEDLPRFADVFASMQPLHKADDGRFAERRVGTGRLGGCFPFRRLLDAGARLAFGSDWPIVSCDPLAGIRSAVTGLTTDGASFRTDQNLGVAEALAAYTSGAAGALRMDHAGTVAPGADADLVVLDRDPFTADWIDAPPRVVLTIAGGAVVYDAGSS